MSNISKPVDWEVFSIPPIQPVQYYSILKKQREFSQLIKQYEAQVFRHGYLHFCGIVPKYLNSSLNNKYEIFIVFLDETPTSSFIGLRVKVSKETFIYESKSLLLFLKKSEKAVFYSMNYNHIHVQCGRNAWELFYLLYDDYLRRYVLTIIGTRFFYNFVYSYYIEMEKQFLKLLYRGSRVIRVSKSSIYYKIHRKRKISVNDLIYMTLNMPKRKKYTLSCFSTKEPLLYSDAGQSDFYTLSGNKINFSKLMLKMYKRQDVQEKQIQKSILTDVTHKRKFDEIDTTNQYLEPSSSSKRFKISKPNFTDNQWEQFQKFKSYSVKNYSTLCFIKPFIPNLLQTGNSFCNSNLQSMGVHSNNYLPLLLSSDNKKIEVKDSIIVQEACTSKDHIKKVTCGNSEKLVKKLPLTANKLSDLKTNSESVIPKESALHCPSLNYHTSFPSTNYLDSTKNCDTNSAHFLKNIEDTNDFVPEDVDFTTAAGKVINVSSAAMLKAYNLCEKEQIFFEEKCSNVVKHELPKKIHHLGSKQISVTKDISLPKISESKFSQGLSFSKNNENMSKKLATAHSTITENLKLDDFDDFEDVTFSTAAGKIIDISNSAVEAATKLIYSTTNEENRPLHSKSSSIERNQFYKNEISNNGCTSRADDVDMDNTLVEKFFEDVQFDEKDLELAQNNIKNDNLSVTDSKNKDLPTKKQRKSLGGRRR